MTHRPGWIELDGVDNMRDVGGLPTSGGGTVVAGRLIRSDNLQELPTASVRHLVDDLGVTDVVDLRTVVEVAKEGDGPMVTEPGVRIHHHTLYTEDTAETGIPAGERKLPWESDRNLGTGAKATARRDHGREERHDAYWSKHYLGYLDRRPDSVVAALRAIGEAEGAVLVHCAAGKDRTGTIVGLALLVVGATPEAVVADFAGKTVAQQEPRAETMRLLVDALEREGGAEAWLFRQGWTAEDTRRLRAKLLEPTEPTEPQSPPA
jgi:protein-tyrosine phosphatase